MQKYSVNQYQIEIMLAWVTSGEIAIPEIQRPFVWGSSKVRDLMDSLYQGYPIGYVIAWRNPNVRLKDGSLSEGKKILIDGQQRITALTAAILGEKVVSKTYESIAIRIAFHPVEERFEVQNPAILKDKSWLADVSHAINGDLFEIAERYFELNPDVDKKKVRNALSKLTKIPQKQIGLIELAPDLDIETVTEIFIRINSKGVVLSQADFAMSKIASNTDYGGNELRKAIDYFCHLCIEPDFFKHIVENDKDFEQSSFFRKMAWLKTEKEDLYDPDYNDVIRVAFTTQFNRGRLSDLVSLLSGRNFETRTYEESIAERAFASLKIGVESFINETNFKRFLMIVKSAGFISPKLIRSQNALNFAYIVYLKLKDAGVNSVDIESYVRRWLVWSILTGRYSGSPESAFDFDVRQICSRPFNEYLKEKEEGELSDAFWNTSLPLSLETAAASSPYFHVFLAAQVKASDKGFLSTSVLITDLISIRGDIHHIFPKDFLKRHGLSQNKYNQIANYVYMQSEINIKVGNRSPKDYMELLRSQIKSGNRLISGHSSEVELIENLKMNAIPVNFDNYGIEEYDDFLLERRKLMALKIHDYYYSL
jgi:hypothetical protein